MNSTISIKSREGETITVSSQLRLMSKLLEETLADHEGEENYQIECDQPAIYIKAIAEYA